MVDGRGWYVHTPIDVDKRRASDLTGPGLPLVEYLFARSLGFSIYFYSLSACSISNFLPSSLLVRTLYPFYMPYILIHSFLLLNS